MDHDSPAPNPRLAHAAVTSILCNVQCRCPTHALRCQESALSPLSPQHVQSTTKRALKAAQPLRDEVQSKVNKLQMRVTECVSTDGSVDKAISGASLRTRWRLVVACRVSTLCIAGTSQRQLQPSRWRQCTVAAQYQREQSSRATFLTPEASTSRRRRLTGQSRTSSRWTP